MSAKTDIEVLYAKTLKDCISLVEEIAEHEQEQIALTLEMGKKVNVLTDKVPDEEEPLKRLSRDIFIARGKMVSPQKLSECQQLYLKFETIEAVNELSGKMLNDITAETLLKTAQKQEKKSNGTEGPDPLESVLERVGKLLNRFERIMNDEEPSREKATGYIRKIEGIQDKITSIIGSLQNRDGKNQIDMFAYGYYPEPNPEPNPEPIAQVKGNQ